MSITISFESAEAYATADTDGYFTLIINGTTTGDNVPVTLVVEEKEGEKTYTSTTNELGVATFEVSGTLPAGMTSYRYSIKMRVPDGKETSASFTVLAD